MGADAELRVALQAYVALVAPGDPALLAWLKRLSMLPQRRRPPLERTVVDQISRWVRFE